MLDRTLEATHVDFIEARNLAEALRIENEDYKVCFNGRRTSLDFFLFRMHLNQ
jgi:hypothetical protein